MKTCNIPHESECLASKHNKQSPFSFSIDRESTSSVIFTLTQSKEGEEVYQKEKEDSIITEFSKEGKENTNSIAKMTTFENSSNNDKEMKYRTNKESFPSVKYFKESDEVKEMIDQREEEKEETTGNERESEEIKTINNLVLVVVEEEEEEKEERESMTQNLIKRRLKKVKKIKRKKNNIEIKEDINNMNEYETAPFIYGGMNFMNPPEVMNCNEMNYQSPFIFDPMIMQMQQQQQQQQQWLQLTQMTQMMQMQMQMAPQMTFNYVNQIPFDIGNEEYNKNKNKNRKRTKEEKNNKTKNKKTRK